MGEEENTKEYVIPSDDEILEITDEDYKEDFTSFEQDVKPTDDPVEMLVERENEKPAKPKKEKKKLTKKTKIIIIVSIVVVLLIAAIVLFVVLRKPKEVKPIKKDDIVVIEKENYRYENGSLVFLDKEDAEIGRYECENKDINSCYVTNQSHDSFDDEKYVYENGDNVDFIMPVIGSRYAFIIDSKENNPVITLYDLESNEKKEYYTEAKYYKLNDGEYIALKNTDNKYGLYKYNAETGDLSSVISSTYDYLGIKIDEANDYGSLVGEKEGRYYILDFSGNEKSKKIGYGIKSFNAKTIITCDDEGAYRVLDYNNNIIFDDIHEFIMLQEDLLITVDNRSLNVYDRNQNKLMSSPIRLSNNNYIKTRVFDKNKKQIELKESFWVIQNEGSITIEYEDTAGDIQSIVINVYESLVSNKYKYVSYYDGELYFYSDETKANLLGTYKCNNQNAIVSEQSEYNNCYFAKESSFSDNELSKPQTTLNYLPIIQNRYVFINDTLDPSSQNINLYDLVDKKVLGTYLNVDLGLYKDMAFYDEDTGNPLVAIYVSANSKRYGKMGVITFGEDGTGKPTSLISAENDYIERMGDYLSVKKQSGTYQLFDLTGAVKSKELAYKILSYSAGLIKTQNNDKYIVFDYEGNALPNATGWTFVDVKDSYYATVIDRKVNVFEIGEASPIISDEEICGFDCYISINKSGKDYLAVTKDGNGNNQTLILSRDDSGEAYE